VGCVFFPLFASSCHHQSFAFFFGEKLAWIHNMFCIQCLFNLLHDTDTCLAYFPVKKRRCHGSHTMYTSNRASEFDGVMHYFLKRFLQTFHLFCIPMIGHTRWMQVVISTV